jgi:uncharacterized protein YegP (UPF0339 family)
MSKRPRWELCRSDDGQWFVRFIAANGQKIVTSETYKRKRDALHAIEVVGGAPVADVTLPEDKGKQHLILTATAYRTVRVVDLTWTKPTGELS